MSQVPKTEATDSLRSRQRAGGISRWHGSLNLTYARRGDSTQVIYNQAQAPLKVQRPFYPEGQAVCHSVILHTAGGMVGSDRLSFNFHVQPNAQALITTTAASKIYRSNGETAEQKMQMQVDAGANLEWLPQETIIFDGAIYRQDIRVELAPGATWLSWEINRFGRSARGEKFLQGEWRSNTEIWQQGRPLWIDRQRLVASEETINSPHSLAGYPIVASLTCAGQAATPELVEKVRNLWHTDPNLSQEEVRGEFGVTRLTQGLLCRYRGNSTAEVRNWFIAVWHLLRFSWWQRPAILPRVWQMTQKPSLRSSINLSNR